jgi:hypothetical protein
MNFAELFRWKEGTPRTFTLEKDYVSQLLSELSPSFALLYCYISRVRPMTTE